MASVKKPGIDQLLEIINTILSTAFISGINIIVSGHILGYVFNLKGSKENHFTLQVPFVLKLGIVGNRAFAGFAAFTLSLLLVACCLSDFACKLFIVNLCATDNRWTATQALATSISVVVCLSILIGRAIWTCISIWQAKNRRPMDTPSPEERAKSLTESKTDKKEEI